MKTTYIICAVGIAIAIAIFSEPLTAKDPEPAEVKVAAKEQKLVRIFESESMLMKGDPLTAEGASGSVLPPLLADGWRIVELHADAAGDGELITTGYVLLER